MKILGTWDLKRIDKLPLPSNTANKPSGTIQNLPANSFASQVVNSPGTVTWQGGNAQEQVKDGYSGNDIVYSIIRLITDKVKMAPWSEFSIKDESNYKKYSAIMQRPDLIQDWKKVNDLRHKSIVLAPKKTKLSDLLDYPNKEDCWSDIVEGWSTFKLVTGNAYLFGKMIGAGVNKGLPNELFNLPSQYMSILADQTTFPISVKSYQLYMQYYQHFLYEEILHDKYMNPNWSIVGLQLYGLSPLQAAAKVLTRSNEGKQAAVSNYQNGGPKGILFVADDRYDPNQSLQEAQDIKKTLARNQGSKNVNQIETSGYKVDYVPLGLSPVDLDLLNAENMDLRALCNVYGGVPSQLLNDPTNKTYANTKEGEKALTVRCALPMLNSIRQQFNRKWGNQGTIIDYDPTVYQELQEGKAETVGWLKDSYLPLRRRLEVMGESLEGYTEEQLNAIFMPSGVTTMDDLLMEKPITPPTGLNDY